MTKFKALILDARRGSGKKRVARIECNHANEAELIKLLESAGIEVEARSYGC